MALDDNAVLKVGSGRFFTAPSGTARPADLLNVEETWEEMGHTSLDDIISGNDEGGETTRLGSLQKRNFKTSVSGTTRSFTINLLQWEEETLRLAYGDNVELTDDGDLGIPEVMNPVEQAWLFLFFDGDTVGGLYAPNASFVGAEAFSISNTEELTQLPIEVTPQTHADFSNPFYVITPREVEGAGDGSGGEGGTGE